MPQFEESVVCTASAVEVWKLLHDPVRFADWWAGVSRVEPGSGEATFYTGEPAVPTPARVTAGRNGGQVVIDCLMTDDVLTWTLEPHPGGCRITVHVEVSQDDPDRLAARHANVLASLPRLVAAAERMR